MYMCVCIHMCVYIFTHTYVYTYIDNIIIKDHHFERERRELYGSGWKEERKGKVVNNMVLLYFQALKVIM